MPVLNLLHRNLTTKTKNLGDLCERNLYTMQFIMTMSELKKISSKNDEKVLEEVENDSDSDEDLLMDTSNVEGLQSKWSDSEDSE